MFDIALIFCDNKNKQVISFNILFIEKMFKDSSL